ncbi:MAG TPA: SEC-C metal-binding domain-containing protein [Acidimicrobiales bacterium]|nr:SEC-C metal-binding domain-containing protein [Acidimicrobiales bacterium]
MTAVDKAMTAHLVETVLGTIARRAVIEAGGACDRSFVVDAVWEELAGGVLDRAQLGDVLEDLFHEPDSVLTSLADGRVLDSATLAERLVLTHRLSEAEVAAESLELDADLSVLAMVAGVDGGLHSADGSPLRLRQRRERGAGRAGGTRRAARLEGPAGWLQEFAPGGIVAARAAGGFLSLVAVDDRELAAPPPDLAGGLARLLDLANEKDGSPVFAWELQVLAALDLDTWFCVPRPPFGELAVAAGFELDDELVGRPGCWEAHKKLGDTVAAIVRHGLAENDVSLLLDMIKAFEVWRGDASSRPSAALVERLRLRWPVAHPAVEELRRRGAEADELTAFAAALGGVVGDWLAARAAALRGAPLEAERLAVKALAVDPSFGPAVSEAAWCAADRGRAREAVNLLQPVRHHDDDELGALRHFAAASAPVVGRNAACPCGSGRKFKQCHLGRTALPDGERLRWLLAKARQFVTEVAPPRVLDDVGFGGVDPQAEALGIDLLLFDGGWLERFVAERGPLLPEMEQDWAENWCGSHVSSVFRIAESGAGGRVVLEDLDGGARYAVDAPETAGAVVGLLVWARLLPVEDRWWTSGVVRFVSLAERGTLFAALAPGTSVADRLEALAPEARLVRISNTSGDPTVLCTTVVAVRDAADATERLDDHFGREGDEQVWHTHADTPGMQQALMAAFRLDGDGRLHIETNSLKRRDAAVELVLDLLGQVDIVDETRVPIARAQAAKQDEELMEMAGSSLGVLGEADEYDDDEDDEDDEGSEELAAAMAAIMEAHEERWLDQAIPALGGRTPRQAVGDESLRPDLVTFLAEMEAGGGFDPDRLRTRLGL